MGRAGCRGAGESEGGGADLEEETVARDPLDRQDEEGLEGCAADARVLGGLLRAWVRERGLAGPERSK